MPVGPDGKCICDGCGKDIEDEFGGYQCPSCGKLYCTGCEPEHDLRTVEVNPKARKRSDQYADMCPACYQKWIQTHPAKPRPQNQASLDGYLQTQAY